MSKLLTRACVLVALFLLSLQAGYAVVTAGDPVHAIAKDKAAGQADYAQTDICRRE